MAASGRTGWYCRVLQEGLIEPDMTVYLVERPYPAWTISLVNDFGHGRQHDLEQARELASCPQLIPLWQELVLKGALS